MANLVVCCDGTWNTPDDTEGGLPAPTNVVKFYNALADADAKGVTQQKYYHPGVGTDGGWWNQAVGGGAGVGLDHNIKSAYQWLGYRYRPGDQIFLIGFSRGAYTVRSLGGMIAKSGLLDISAADLSPEEAWRRINVAFDYYRLTAATDELKKLPAHDKREGDPPGGSTKIFFIGVWDTVGALGIPDDMGLLNLIDNPRKHSFHDTDLSNCVLNARHAMAMDERRQTFTPTVWTGVEDREQVKQIWFPGVHADVGGGYADRDLSDGSLAWMMKEAKALGLEFRGGVEAQLNPKSGGPLHNSLCGVFKVLKCSPRAVPVVTSQEAFHQSALDRYQNPPIDQGPYWPTRVLQIGETITIDIFAREHWNATHIFLEENTSYQLSASGEWMDASIKCGPAGMNDGSFHLGEVVHLAASAFGQIETAFRRLTGNTQADFWWTKRDEDLPWFALVGVTACGSGADRYGNPRPHKTFNIGAGCPLSIKSGEAGYFYCFANDAWQAYGNNKGSVALTVERTA